MSKFPREKGKRFERQLACALREYGYDTHRTAQHCGKAGDAADVAGLPGIWIEAKHQEKMRLYDWYEQAVRDSAGTGLIPVVVHKQNNKDVLVTLNLENFMEIYKEWEADDATKHDPQSSEIE